MIGQRRRRWLWVLPLMPLLVMGAGVLVIILAIAALVGGSGSATAAPQHVPGIPAAMLEAYTAAAEKAAVKCKGMRWSILAGIAAIESRHAAGRTIAANGDITPKIEGPELDGSGVGGNTTPIRNPDGTFARAVGPFQFLTTTWATWGRDGNGDGRKNPHNAFDASLGAAAYLCGKKNDLIQPGALQKAIYTYNHSQQYVRDVMANIEQYDTYGSDPFEEEGAGVAATGDAKTVIQAAMAKRGTSYAWGGGNASGPTKGIRDGGVADAHGDYKKVGFDCSGLVVYAYAKVGVSLPRTSSAQFNAGRRIPASKGLAGLKPGDLVFYSPGTIHHVGIYIGNGKMVNAPQSGSVVRVDRLDLSEYAGGARVLRA